MSKVDLKAYGSTTLEGVITAVYVMPLREWLKSKKKPLTDAVIDEKFNNPDRDNVIVVGECNGSAIDGFFAVSKFQGYQKSNLKRFIERNQLPLVELPKEAKKWLGHKAEVKVDGNGFLRWAV